MQEEYTLDNVIYALELRPIEGDLARPQNYLSTPDFTPQGNSTLDWAMSLSARIKTGDTCYSNPVISLDTMISLDKCSD